VRASLYRSQLGGSADVDKPVKTSLPSNPCWGVEFPVAVKGCSDRSTFHGRSSSGSRPRPHAIAQRRFRIVTETGLRIDKGLTPMKKDQVDLGHKTVWIPDSKTPNGVAEVPLSDVPVEALRNQMQLAGERSYLFPSENAVGHQTTFKPSGGSRCGERRSRTFGYTTCAPRPRPA
jgi:Phage integrase family